MHSNLPNIDCLALPKLGNAMAEREDAYWTDVLGSPEGSFCCAVADGVSQSIFSGEWACVLAQAYCEHGGDCGSLLDGRTELKSRWEAEIPSEDELSWLVRPRLSQGSHSTLIGVRFDLSDQEGCWNWNASAVGDSCLFVLPSRGPITMFPELSKDDFGTSPELIATNSNSNLFNSEFVGQTSSGEVCSGDVMMLMTDSMACWVLGRDHPKAALRELMSMDQSTFSEIMSRCVAWGDLDDDDLTVLRIRF